MQIKKPPRQGRGPRERSRKNRKKNKKKRRQQPYRTRNLGRTKRVVSKMETPGKDDIDNRVLRRFTKKVAVTLTNIINAMLRYFPQR